MDKAKRLEMAMELVKLDLLAQLASEINRGASRTSDGPASRYMAMRAGGLSTDVDALLTAALQKIDELLA